VEKGPRGNGPLTVGAAGLLITSVDSPDEKPAERSTGVGDSETVAKLLPPSAAGRSLPLAHVERPSPPCCIRTTGADSMAGA
jgi:hypothetical protein